MDNYIYLNSNNITRICYIKKKYNLFTRKGERNNISFYLVLIILCISLKLIYHLDLFMVSFLMYTELFIFSLTSSYMISIIVL